MLVFEYRLKVRMKKNIAYEECAEKIGHFIDSALCKDKEYLEFHRKTGYKWYTFDLPAPIEPGKVYQVSKTYYFRIRTVLQNLAEYFSRSLIYHITDEMVGLTGELRIIPKKPLEKLFSLTPLIQLTDHGYWRDHLSLEEFENQIKVNLIKKYNMLNQCRIEDESFHLYRGIVFKNKKPVKVKYKNITLLGDKIEIMAETNPMAQELLYLSIGCGMGAHNSRGAGFMGYKYLD
ncbi:MAG TPA: CRISPR-associated endoribonuclease Cas6 [Candidatus Fimimorpha excrementavium]|nr:CRISPR-associated endoribonuclease Cas6 [Candidatus Fimimorpha excrementavium]